jgi:N-acyl-D-amino-acid deacylase
MRVFAVLALVACGGSSPAPDAPEDVAACEADLAARWAATPPVTGYATAEVRTAYGATLRSLMTQYAIPGAAVAVVRNGQLVAALGVGWSDRDAVVVAHPDSRFRIASVSKQLTATAILHLVEDGKLSLDDHPFQLLSELTTLDGKPRDPALAAITVHQLLHHTGGWNRDFEPIGDPMFASQTISAAAGIAGPADVDSIIRYMLDQPTTYAAGSTYCYSNFGYAVLGKLIEHASGTSYDAYVQAHVLAPAGASEIAQGHTHLADRQDGEVGYYGFAGEALATSVFPGESQVPWEYGGFFLEAMAAHGAWIASPVDMMRFATTIDHESSVPDQLTPASLAAMIADPHVPSCTPTGGTMPEDPSYWYGFGLEANASGNLWHTGSLPGTATEDVIAGNGYSWAVFTNTRSATPGEPNSALDQHLWDPVSTVTRWGAHDRFDHYPAFTAWTPAGDFATALAQAQAAGMDPSRLEARVDAGAVELRARFAPRIGKAADVGIGLDCPSFVAHDRELASVQSYVDAGGVRRFQAVWADPL